MAMTHTFDLQRFADSNVQTTGTQSLSAEMKTYYGMELLENAKPALVHNQSSPPPSLCLWAAARPWSGASSAPLTRR